MKPKAIVIGGGLGGLATALTLSEKYEVHIFEKNKVLGGKMCSIDEEGFHFDFGPNTLTMPHYFWQVIAPFCDAKQKLPFKKIDYPTNHRMANFDIAFTTNEVEMVEQLRKIDEQSALNYPSFINEIKRLFHLSEKTFLEKTFFKTTDYMEWQLARDLVKAHPLQTLHQFIKHYFPNPLVQQLFERFATYIGSSPYATPATFAMIAYFELVEGTYYLEGGATKIAAVFTELLQQQGVQIHLNEGIEKVAVDGKKIIFCETNKGRHHADLFICNTDFDLFQSLLGRPMTKDEMSTSAYVELIGLSEPINLHHHNVLFSDQYEEEFSALRKGEYAEKPTVYSCYPYVSDQSHLPSLFVLINAPSRDVHYENATRDVDDALGKWGITEQMIRYRKVLPTSFIEQQFSVTQGAIYGRASNSLKGSFFRPPNKDHKLNNLYYVGGTVHPGGGSPIVVKGGYHVAKRILETVY